MTQNNNDILARAYVTLSSLRKNIDQIADPHIPEKYVHQYHKVLDRVQNINIDVAEFSIPDSEVKPIITSRRPVNYSSGVGGEAIYSKDKYVDKQFILMKLDSILGYFQIITSDKPRRMGFSPPTNR